LAMFLAWMSYGLWMGSNFTGAGARLAACPEPAPGWWSVPHGLRSTAPASRTNAVVKASFRRLRGLKNIMISDGLI
jgi:hypothetical protein